MQVIPGLQTYLTTFVRLHTQQITIQLSYGLCYYIFICKITLFFFILVKFIVIYFTCFICLSLVNSFHYRHHFVALHCLYVVRICCLGCMLCCVYLYQFADAIARGTLQHAYYMIMIESDFLAGLVATQTCISQDLFWGNFYHWICTT